MEAKSNASTDWVVASDVPTSCEPLGTPLALQFVLMRNVRSGELRLDVHMPYPDELRLPQDLGVLLHNFGWAVAAECMKLRTYEVDEDYETWHGCCQVLEKVDFALNLVDGS